MNGHQFRKRTGHAASGVRVRCIDVTQGSCRRFQVMFQGDVYGTVESDEPTLSQRWAKARSLAYELVASNLKGKVDE